MKGKPISGASDNVAVKSERKANPTRLPAAAEVSQHVVSQTPNLVVSWMNALGGTKA